MNWEKQNEFNNFLSRMNFKNEGDLEWCFANEKNKNLLDWMTKNISSSNFLTKQEIQK
jgi:hypothetical protein